MPGPLSSDNLPPEVFNVYGYRGIEYDSQQNRLVAAFDGQVKYPMGSQSRVYGLDENDLKNAVDRVSSTLEQLQEKAGADVDLQQDKSLLAYDFRRASNRLCDYQKALSQMEGLPENLVQQIRDDYRAEQQQKGFFTRIKDAFVNE